MTTRFAPRTGPGYDVLMNDHEYWMRMALEQARRAGEAGEVPVGAVVVDGGELVAAAGNACIADHDPSAHAEIVALRRAGQALGNYRLATAILYVTLEPCIMCAGAMVHARLAKVVYGAADPRCGAAGSVADVLRTPFLNHRCEVLAGVLAAPCQAMLHAFFDQRREGARG